MPILSLGFTAFFLLILVSDLMFWVGFLIEFLWVYLQVGLVYPWLLGSQKHAHYCWYISPRGWYSANICWYISISFRSFHLLFIFQFCVFPQFNASINRRLINNSFSSLDFTVSFSFFSFFVKGFSKWFIVQVSPFLFLSLYFLKKPHRLFFCMGVYEKVLKKLLISFLIKTSQRKKTNFLENPFLVGKVEIENKRIEFYLHVLLIFWKSFFVMKWELLLFAWCFLDRSGCFLANYRLICHISLIFVFEMVYKLDLIWL